MASVATRYGETGASPYLLPFSVDGLIVVASICLVELGGRIRAASDATSAPVEPPPAEPAPQPVKLPTLPTLPPATLVRPTVNGAAR